MRFSGKGNQIHKLSENETKKEIIMGGVSVRMQSRFCSKSDIRCLMGLKRQQTLAKCKMMIEYPGKRARNADLKNVCPLHSLHCRNKNA